MTKMGNEVEIMEGWSWEPVDGIYPALVIMDSLMGAIRADMRIIHRQALIVNGEDIPKHKFPKCTAYFGEEKDKIEFNREYISDDDFDKSEYSCPWDEVEEVPFAKIVTENKPTKKKTEKETHIKIDEEKAKKIYHASNADGVKWLVEPMDETVFVNRLTLPPSGEKIKYKQLNQIYYITKHYLYPPKNGKKKRNLTKEIWDLIKKVFDTEDGKMDNVDTATKTPQNSEKFDFEYRFSGRK